LCLSIGIYTSGCAFSLKGEACPERCRRGWDEGEFKYLILFSSAIAPALLYLLHPCSRHPIPLQQERVLGTVATHCFLLFRKVV